MVHNGIGFHHFHRSKSKTPKKKWAVIDYAIIVSGIMSLILTIPQVTTIWMHHAASGVSVISWIAYTITATVWLIYGIIHREASIIALYLIWIVVDLSVVIGTIIYN